MSKATDTQWRVQVRKSRNHKWVNKWLCETRHDARFKAYMRREHGFYESNGLLTPPVGFGNTRVVKYQKK